MSPTTPPSCKKKEMAKIMKTIAKKSKTITQQFKGKNLDDADIRWSLEPVHWHLRNALHPVLDRIRDVRHNCARGSESLAAEEATRLLRGSTKL